VNCNLVFQEHFHEDVCSHLVGQAALDVNVAICYGLMDKVELNVDVFGTSMIIIIHGKVKGCLIIAEVSQFGLDWFVSSYISTTNRLSLGLLLFIIFYLPLHPAHLLLCHLVSLIMSCDVL
jgi:hypothetical protein